MAFVVQCPFCAFETRITDRANGIIGRCPGCGRTFPLERPDAPALPDAQAGDGAQPDAEPHEASADADAAPGARPAVFQPTAAAGAVALLLSGAALIFASTAWLRGLAIPLGVVALLAGLAALALSCLSGNPRLLLPVAGTTAALALLIVFWLFPALFWPVPRQLKEPLPAGLHAIPLGDAPALAGPPEWVDAKRYALQRDGLRVRVFGVSFYRPAPDEFNPAPAQLLVVRVRVSLEQADATPLRHKGQPAPALIDDAGRPCLLQKNEFVNRADRKASSVVFLNPTMEETFAFEAPAEGTNALRLELSAERWNRIGVFRFTLACPPRAEPGGKKKVKEL